jgi:hypothetical protein
VIEVGWTTAALLPTSLWIVNLMDTWRDRQIAHESGDPARRLVARLSVFLSCGLIAVGLLYIVQGLLAMTYSPNPDSNSLERVSVGTARIVVSVILAVLAMYWKYVKVQLLELARSKTGVPDA